MTGRPLYKGVEKMFIRKATMEDLDRITELEARCFPPAEAASRERLAGRLASYPEGFWLGFDDFRELICYVGGPVTREADLTDDMYEDPEYHKKDGDWQMIFSVCTAPEQQRQGLASIVLQRVIRESKALGRKGVVLTCKEDKIHYYARFGFENEGISDSVHGGAVWYQMRMTFDEEYAYEHMFDISDDPRENKRMFEDAFWGSQC